MGGAWERALLGGVRVENLVPGLKLAGVGEFFDGWDEGCEQKSKRRKRRNGRAGYTPKGMYSDCNCKTTLLTILEISATALLRCPVHITSLSYFIS